METTNHIGQRVKRARLGLGLTQDVLAERVGCATQTIRKIEAGERRPSYQMAERLASTLGFSPDEQRAFVADARQFETPTEPQREPEQTERRQPRNLPTYLTPFLGRSGLQRELARRLADPDCRLITLLGPGGIGKTRLAVEAIRVAAPHPYDVAFVPLASIADAQEIVPAIGAALEYSFSGAVDLTTQLVRRLREERLLLVLDNLEHLTEQRGLTTILTTLLHHVPGLTILATSREQLMMGGEWVIALDGLDVPADESGQQIEQIEAVALFVERAQRLDHSFALQAENRVAVAQICRLLEGTPLAVDLGGELGSHAHLRRDRRRDRPQPRFSQPGRPQPADGAPQPASGLRALVADADRRAAAHPRQAFGLPRRVHPRRRSAGGRGDAQRPLGLRH